MYRKNIWANEKPRCFSLRGCFSTGEFFRRWVAYSLKKTQTMLYFQYCTRSAGVKEKEHLCCAILLEFYIILRALYITQWMCIVYNRTRVGNVTHKLAHNTQYSIHFGAQYTEKMAERNKMWIKTPHTAFKQETNEVIKSTIVYKSNHQCLLYENLQRISFTA